MSHSMSRLLSAALLFAASALAPARAQLPGDSIYQLQSALVNQDGRSLALDLHQGHPTVVSMFYGSCPHVCPMLIATIRHHERQLDEASRGRLRVLMVSLDPQRDTPPKLQELAQRHRLDLQRWTLARFAEQDVRLLAAALGIRYRRLPDGEFNHSTVITLLDGDGRVLHQTSSLAAANPEFVDALRRATAAR